MGSRISIDKHVSNIEDILEMNPGYFTKIKFENKIPELITQHIKIWRYYEEDKKTRNIKCAPISLQNIQNSNFTFSSNECYLVLFVYRKGAEESTSFSNFPHSMWGLVESYSNLTPRGLEVPAATSESASSYNKDVLESFLVPKKPTKIDDGKYEYMIFVWNGKNANPLVKSLALSAAFEFESLINRAKDPLLQVLFSGGVIRNKKLQKGTILQLNSSISKELNKDHEKQFQNMRQTIYLFKFLFPMAEGENQTTKYFNKNFLLKNNSNKVPHYNSPDSRPEDFIAIGDHINNYSSASKDEIKIHEFNSNQNHSQSSDGEDNEYTENPPVNRNKQGVPGLSLHIMNRHQEQAHPIYEQNGQENHPMMNVDPNHTGSKTKMKVSLPLRLPIPTTHATTNNENMNINNIDTNHVNHPVSSHPQIPVLGIKNLINHPNNNDSHNNDHKKPGKLGFGLALPQKTEEKSPKGDVAAPEDGGVGAEEKIKNYEHKCNEVIPGLYVAGEKIAYNYQKLKEVGITHVINCAGDVCENKFKSELDYLTYYLKDHRTENIECVFYETIRYIENALQNNGKVLVHCVQGVSRSVTICIAYLLYTNRCTYEEGFNMVRKSRGVASPNMGFILQLMQFEKRLKNILEVPRIFSIGSHQKETPQLIVARLLLENLYTVKNPKCLDPRSVFIIQLENKIYLWIGNQIHGPNVELYMKCADEYIKVLQEQEKAPTDVVVVECEKEPADFWSIWENEPEVKHGFNKEWDMWFLDTSQYTAAQGPTYIRENPDDNKIIGTETRPWLYLFPEDKPLKVFDDEDLEEDTFAVICKEKDGVKNAYIWKGEAFAQEDEEQYFLEAAIKNKWPNEYFNNINKIYVTPFEETKEFQNLFTSTD
jgi:protein-tyrosine phosphatase